jgi:hypothetical protein
MTKPLNERRRRVGKLTNATMVSIEIARIYRQCRRGEMDTTEGYRYANILSLLAKCLEQSNIEQRMAELEAALAAQSEQPQPLRRAA